LRDACGIIGKSQGVGFDGGNFKKIRSISAKNIEYWIFFVIKISIEKNSMKFGLQIEAKKLYHSIL